jgi:hypothetical protein
MSTRSLTFWCKLIGLKSAWAICLKAKVKTHHKVQCDPLYFTFGQGTQILMEVGHNLTCTLVSKSIGMDRFWRLNDIMLWDPGGGDKISRSSIYGLNLQRRGWYLCLNLKVCFKYIYALNHQFGHFKTFVFVLTWSPLNSPLFFIPLYIFWISDVFMNEVLQGFDDFCSLTPTEWKWVGG